MRTVEQYSFGPFMCAAKLSFQDVQLPSCVFIVDCFIICVLCYAVRNSALRMAIPMVNGGEGTGTGP